MVELLTVKTCSKCHVELPLSEFNLHNGVFDGHQPTCRACQAAYNAVRYATSTPEQRTARAAKSSATRRAQYRAETRKQKDARNVKANIRWRAGYVTLGFFGRRASSGISADELRAIWDRQGGLCALTGRVLRQDRSSELDHIVPRAEGGADGAPNRQWVCRAANILKNNLSDAEFVRFCIEVATHYQGNLLTPLSRTKRQEWMSSLMAAPS